jgi:hypothetical protein
MLRRDWAMLVVGTALGILFLTADLLGVGWAPGFGWKQIVGTLASAVIVGFSAWRIVRRGRQDLR